MIIHVVSKKEAIRRLRRISNIGDEVHEDNILDSDIFMK